MPVRLDFLRLNVPRTTHWRGDLRGGVQAAAVALPMGLAFGVVSGLGPVAGVYSAICTGLFAALFGGTATQVSGPTGPIAIVMASVVVGFADQPGAVFAVIMLAGVLQFAFGALRLGRYISLIPYPVMSGFATGVGCIIIVMQLNPLLGHPAVGDTRTAVALLPRHLLEANWTAALIALGCLAACRFLPRTLRTVAPVHLTVLVVASAAIAITGIDVPHLAAPATLLPHLNWPPWSELPWEDVWIAAVVLALISSLDSLLTSIAADSATQQFHDSDRELVGQGLGNLFAGLFGALPGAGSTFRTMANIRAGGRTPLSGVIHSIVLLALLLGLGNLIEFIPASVLAGILVYIGLGIIDWKYIRRFLVVPPGGVVIMVVVWFIALFVNVVTAAAVGMVMASLAFVKRMADLQLEALDPRNASRAASGLTREERAAFDRAEGRTLFIHLSGPLTFGAATGITKRFATMARYQAIVLEFTDVPHIDESGMLALENIVHRAHEMKQVVLLVGLQSRLIRPIIRFGLRSVLRSCPRFRRRLDALEYAAKIGKPSGE